MACVVVSGVCLLYFWILVVGLIGSQKKRERPELLFTCLLSHLPVRQKVSLEIVYRTNVIMTRRILLLVKHTCTHLPIYYKK